MTVKEPANKVVEFLRKHLPDYSTSRSGTDNGRFIQPGFPEDFNDSITNYPKVTVTQISEEGEHLGMFEDSTWDTVNFQIDVFCKKTQGMNTTNDYVLFQIDTSSASQTQNLTRR